MRLSVTLAIIALTGCLTLSAQRYAGGDISLLPDYEAAGAKYRDHAGQPIADLIPWLHDQGMNAMRVRLFVDPDTYRIDHAADSDPDTRYDPNACQSLEYILPLCRRIVDAGMALMLDIHYSDTWADPAKQWTPKAWEGLDDEALASQVYDYTRSVLLALRDAGVTPAFIQTGNEISYGMLWGPVGTDTPLKTLMGSDANWERLAMLLKSAGRACRQVCPDARIVLHTERVAQTGVTTNFYDKMSALGVDYDIIGLSYYPYFHGPISVLDRVLNTLQARYPLKSIMIVETGYPLKWEVPGTTHDTSDVWPLTEAGQLAYATDLVDTLEAHPTCDGLFWWWLEYNPFGTSLSGWYNAPLFNPSTGRATAALAEICSYATTGGLSLPLPDSTPSAPAALYDLSGRPVSHPAPGQILILTSPIASPRKLIIR